jgi:tRNA nucleotidyltransferase (CCA-adding enzyme)
MPMPMQIYEVGGAVRDALLGEAVQDHDWVVVGATPEQMLALGYTPVGKDFPVFLHPHTKDEFALARTERKSGKGYTGFVFHASPEVTLEQDLARRDLTINAIAKRPDGTLVDPFNGVADLRAGVLRHVGDAFAEDPVRLLRVARFAARWPHFRVADDTLALCARLVDEGEVDALVPERVWQELARGLMETAPGRMFDLLRACGALARLLPEVDRLWGVPQPAAHHPEIDTGVHLMMVLEMAAQLRTSLAVRWACLVHDLGKGTTPQAVHRWAAPEADEPPPGAANAVSVGGAVTPRHLEHEKRSVELADAIAQRLKVPSDCRELGEIVAREHGNVHASAKLDGAAIMRLFERCDALRRPQRFADALLACECDARGRKGLADEPYPQRARLQAALDAALAADAAAAARDALARGKSGDAVGEAVRRVRLDAIRDAL